MSRPQHNAAFLLRVGPTFPPLAVKLHYLVYQAFICKPTLL
jgi:hypothetical protein